MAQLSSEDQDKISEASQICMAHSATTLNLLINREVTISTPMLKVVNRTDIKNLITAFGIGSMTVQIDYKNDFHCNNLLMLKENDIKIIMDLMLGGSGVAAEGEMNEMHISCASEVLNQMMGSASIALTEMINKTVDINPPKATMVNVKEDIDKIDSLPFPGDDLVIVVFHFEAKGLLKGIMIRLYTMETARFICDNFKIRKRNE